MDSNEFAITLTLREGLSFDVDFDQPDGFALLLDEPPPVGRGRGPNAARLLAAAIGNCLSASLVHCLTRARIPVDGMRTTVTGTMTRNERGRLRIGGLQVKLEPSLPLDDADRMTRCRELFEDFCIVTASVREGIDVAVQVAPMEAAIR